MNSIHHVWKKTTDPHIKMCERCGCIKYWDADFGRIVYQYLGKLLFKSPMCDITTQMSPNRLKTVTNMYHISIIK